MRRWLLIAWSVLLLPSCKDNPAALQGPAFGTVIKYGYGARNELNTLTGSFTKDLGSGGLATTLLLLDPAELDSIETRLLDIDFSSYPDTFTVEHGDTLCAIAPYLTYEIRTIKEGKQKSVFWKDAIISPDPRGVRLRGFMGWVQALIESKPEYKRLPPAQGAYL